MIDEIPIIISHAVLFFLGEAFSITLDDMGLPRVITSDKSNALSGAGFSMRPR